MKGYYSTKTKNESFISMWRHLQRIGVSNNIFMLKTYNSKLHNFTIDKIKEMDLTSITDIQLKKELVEECKLNPWFYFREIVQLDLHLDEMLMLYLYEKKCSFIIIRDNEYKRIKNFLFILWNYHKAVHHSTDIVITENRKKFLQDSDMINKQIVKFPILFGGSQIVSDPVKHLIITSHKEELPLNIESQIEDIKKYFMVQNSWKERNVGIFNFDDLSDSEFYDRLIFSISEDTRLNLCMSSKYEPLIHFDIPYITKNTLDKNKLPNDIFYIKKEDF